MKNILITKLNRIFLMVIIFVLSIGNFAFADDEIEVDYDIYNSFEGWYKNWIMELGGVRITLRDTNGEILTDLNVLPKQFESKTLINRRLAEEGISNQKDKNGNEIFFMQKADGKVNFKDFMPDLEIKYSDNIPQLTKIYDDVGDKLPYVYIIEEFNKDFITVDTWEAYNNGENVNKLADDLDLTSFSEGKVFYEWLKTANAEGLSPSLELQPLCLYPETTEQIYCNKLDVAKEFILQWNSDYSAFEEAFGELSTATGIWKLIDKATTFVKLKLGLGMIAFYDIGILHYKIETTKYEGYSGNAQATPIEVIDAQDPKYINLTYTQTTTYKHPWETDGFWKNFQKFDGPLAIGYYDFLTSIEVSGGKIYDLSDPNKEYKTIKVTINGSTHTVERAMVLKNEYETRYEIWQEQTFGIGEGTTIKTDHNKYTTIINGTGKLIEKLLTLPDFETTALPNKCIIMHRIIY